MMLDRRGALRLSGGLAAAALLPWPAKAAGNELPGIPALPVRRPEPGVVEAELEARVESVTLGGRSARLWTYGGSFPGRGLEAREGETLRLHFTNHLPAPTNLHFHGLHIPPTGRADNVWLHIPPGESFTYEFSVPSGIAGTYWYHSHAH